MESNTDDLQATFAAPQIISAELTGVLGEYTHRIDFTGSTNFLIVYGPNGIGKTKFLEALDGLISLNAGKLARLPFDTASIQFASGEKLSARFQSVQAPAEREQNGSAKTGPITTRVLSIELSRYGVQLCEPWQVDPTTFDDFELWLQNETSWRPYADSIWEDARDGELAHIDDLSQRFAWRERRPGKRARTNAAAPAALRKFADGLSSHLIETQRLRVELTSERSAIRRHQSTIVGYALTMRDLLSEALAQNSRVTQQLDRTFPSRVLSADEHRRTLTEAEIRDKYELQNRFRSRLAGIAVIGLEPELALPDRGLSTWEVSMLDLYLQDADEKLKSFEELLRKIEVLEAIINQRLLRKRFSVNARDGISVTHEITGRSVALDSLSSGEQHEIILMFDLLFNVRSGSLVLIDEPEISLHVGWQVDFIADVEKIASLNGFQFVVATHSPQIINHWWKRAVRLGPPDAQFFGDERAIHNA